MTDTRPRAGARTIRRSPMQGETGERGLTLLEALVCPPPGRRHRARVLRVDVDSFSPDRAPGTPATALAFRV
jgi:hypothetical protein